MKRILFNCSQKSRISSYLKKGFSFLLILIFFISVTSGHCITATAAETSNLSWPEAPSIVSDSAILIDADTGGILYQKNPHDKYYPASTTKILTGLLTIENCSLNETVTFSSEAANSITWEDANLGTKAGEQYTVDQALHALLLYSANEVAYGLAEHVGGNLSNFVDMMNKRAKELGAIDSHFNNASGLYDPDHYTTAYDMAMIARGCYNNSIFVSIDSTADSYTIPPTNMTSQPRTFKHRHKMLEGREYYYEYCKGGKTGYTDQSGSTLVTFAEKDGMRLICVCFKSTDDDRFKDTRSLFDWGFTNFKKITASSDTISSLFNSTNYYNSAVFSKYDLSFKLSATPLTIPNSASTSAIHLTADNNYTKTTDNGSYSTGINFMYGDNTVGATTLILSKPDAWDGNSNLPYITNNTQNNTLKSKFCISVNLWVLLVIIILIIVVFYILKIRHENDNRLYKRRRRFHKVR